jgi:uncharacterized membrane protein
MIYIFVLIVIAFWSSAALMWFSSEGSDGVNDIAGVFGFIGMTITGIASIICIFLGLYWVAADHQANIINREYNTSYTQAEVFFASDVIDTIRQIKRNRYEVNGDLMQKEPKEKP